MEGFQLECAHKGSFLKHVLVVGRWETTVGHVDVRTRTYIGVPTLSPQQKVDTRLATALNCSTQGHALRVNHTGVTQECNDVYVIARSGRGENQRATVTSTAVDSDSLHKFANHFQMSIVNRRS